MATRLQHWFDQFLPPLPNADEETVRRLQRFVQTCFYTPCFALLYAIISYAIGYYAAVPVLLFSVVSMPILPILLRRQQVPYNWLVTTLLTIIVIGWLFFVATQGGVLVADTTPWLVIIPVMALLLTDSGRVALHWLGVVVLVALLFYVASAMDWRFPMAYDPALRPWLHATALTGLFTLVYVLMSIFHEQKQRALAALRAQNQLLEAERQRSDALLRNILPAQAADELRQTGRTRARYYPDVTILLLDITRFTTVAETLPPDALVALIDTYYRAFDRIVAQHGLEKIKTIGDAYLAVGGLPAGNQATAVNVVRAALAMQQFVAERRAQCQRSQQPYFEVRIGIHHGPLVAGVVGESKFQFDIWGDAVNVAARIEQHSVPGRINLSQAVYERIKDEFACVHRGKIDAKHKGELDMYFLEDQPTTLSIET